MLVTRLVAALLLGAGLQAIAAPLASQGASEPPDLAARALPTGPLSTAPAPVAFAKRNPPSPNTKAFSQTRRGSMDKYISDLLGQRPAGAAPLPPTVVDQFSSALRTKTRFLANDNFYSGARGTGLSSAGETRIYRELGLFMKARQIPLDF